MGVAHTVTFSSEGAVILIDTDLLQFAASTTVNVYVPAERVNVPVPVYGGVPPLATTVTVELPPLQRMGVAVTDAWIGGAPYTVTVATDVQFFESVTVKLYVPGVR
jgi:hypothetical protein